MYLTYCDCVGQLRVRVDGIDFCDGYAYFNVREETQKIPVSSIISICSAMTKSYSDVNRISVSAGNTKMGAIRSFSLPPIQTCPKRCPCADKCYAAKICRLRPIGFN